MLWTTGLLKGKKISASPISYTLLHSFVLWLFWTDTLFIFKVFSVASNSYENIDAVQGVDFSMNAAKILEETLSVCRCLYRSFVL